MDRFRARQRRQTLREEAIAHLGGRCQICGYDRCPEALEFHHLDPGEKDFTISRRLGKLSALLPELRKCALLCANCHREVHAGQHPRFLALDYQEGGGLYDDDSESS